MLVDISHTSVQTMHDVLTHSLAPPIFSHSSAYSIHKHERNVPDSVLKRLKKTDGVVMINFYKQFISGEKSCTVDTVAKHVLHVARVAGWRYLICFPIDVDMLVLDLILMGLMLLVRDYRIRVCILILLPRS